jgi:hypothetical protein
MTVSSRTVWALWGLVAVAILVTYSHVPVEQLYHVSHEGVVGAAGRVLVFVNFPVALVAVALVAIAVDPKDSRGADVLGLFSVVLCAVVAWPGVVDQSNLDAKPVNALPAIGVAIALALSLAAHDPGGRVGLWQLAACIALLVAALPWIAADLGFHFGAGVFRSGQPFEGKPSVHLGHHHGLDGTLLAVTAVLLWRAGDRMRRRHLRAVTRGYLALMLSYGLVNAANDFWDEQVVKRGWATRMIPNALVPSVSVIWLIVLTGAAVLYALGFARRDIVPLTGDNHTR